MRAALEGVCLVIRAETPAEQAGLSAWPGPGAMHGGVLRIHPAVSRMASRPALLAWYARRVYGAPRSTLRSVVGCACGRSWIVQRGTDPVSLAMPAQCTACRDQNGAPA